MIESIALDESQLRAGMRVVLAVSGGADSVSLLRAMVERASAIGLVQAVVHVHHGIRGEAADEDAGFVEALAERYGLPFYLRRVDTPAYAAEHRETLEEAARNQRYTVFGELMEQGLTDAVLTAHTLDDQAETVMMKLLRGAWTEGLGGIHPVLSLPHGVILRPLLGVRRVEVEAWLRQLGQPWREDATNADTAFTRNRIRHELLPELTTYNPQIAKTLAQLAELARDEDAYWRQEMNRLLPTLLLPGKAVRGGGRAVTTRPGEGSLGMELDRLRALDAAVRRRALREAARRLGVTLGFEPVERLMAMVKTEGAKPAPRREQLTEQLWAERTLRELRLVLESGFSKEAERQAGPGLRLEPVEISVPGESDAAAYGLRVRASLRGGAEVAAMVEPLVLRVPNAGDRVRLRYTSGKKPLKEVFARLHLDSSLRSTWPLIVWRGEVVWMKDVVVEPDPTLPFTVDVSPLEES
jgi:tRNA(Ile)-lysidine synthase